MKKTLLLLLSVLTLTTVAVAQPKPTYTTKNKKSIKRYEEALAAYDLRDLALAKKILIEVTEEDSQFIESFYMLAQVYDDLGETANAIVPLQKALAINEKYYPEGWLMLAECYFAKGQYNEAEMAVSKYMPFPHATADLEKRAQVILSSCIFAKKAVQSPVNFSPVNLGAGVNTEMDEYYPCITADESTLLFTRLVRNESAYRGIHEDFFISSKKDNEWKQASPVMEINTIQNEGAPSLSADGQTLIFTACELGDGSFGGSRQGVGSCDLFYTMKSGNGWMPAKNLGNAINSGSWESQPSFSADGRTLFFVRGRRTAQGIREQDVYYSYIMDDGKWAPAKKVPGKVNTMFEEESVMIHPDGNTLYFASNGHPGMGGLDIFMSRLLPSGEWDTPVNLGYPINTFEDENSLQVSAKGKLALFASKRSGGFGGLDLYSFELPEFAQPNMVTYVAGLVSDKLSFKKLGAKLELIDLASGKRIIETYSNNVSGDFLVCIPSGKDYALNVSKEGYLFYSENFSLKNYKSAQPYYLNVLLQKLKVGANVVLNNVFFASNSYELLSESKVELDKLVGLLTANPSLRIEIGGHTDDVGKDEDNQILSERRAEAVRSFLIKSGISEGRITFKGYGETNPIVPNDTDSNRSKNRRTEFKIIE